MKKTLLLIVVALLPLATFSQANDKFIDKASQYICDCLNKKDLDLENATAESVELAMGLCFIELYQANEKEINKAYGKILEDDAAMESMAYEIGINMVGKCPEVIIALSSSGVLDDDSEYEEYGEDYKQITATITKVEANQFIEIEVKDDTGKRHKLLWMDYFEGDEIVLDAMNKKDKNKYSIEYIEKEYFDPITKEYRAFKVITGLY